MNLTEANSTKLRRRKFAVEMFMLGCAILAFGWIGAAFAMVIEDAELRQNILRIFAYLWLWIGVIPLCGFFICLFWRTLLIRKIESASK
jgi:hypothetical protein